MSTGDPGTAGAAFTDASSLYVRHADDALVVLDKPAGLPCVPGRPAELADCLVRRAQARWPDARVVHRLDMATSGLVAMALGATAQRRLSDAFAARAVDKRYVAVVEGLVEPAAVDGDGWAAIDLPLAADWPRRPRQRVLAVAEGGRPSLTRWRVLSRDTARGTTRLELRPVTGRTHQLRVHLLAIGHPIVGDTLYGRRDLPCGAAPLQGLSGLACPGLGSGHVGVGRREQVQGVGLVEHLPGGRQGGAVVVQGALELGTLAGGEDGPARLVGSVEPGLLDGATQGGGGLAE